VDEAISKYASLSKNIFTSKSNNSKAKFDHRVLEQQIKDIVEAIPPHKPLLQLEDTRANLCRTFVVSTSVHGGGAVRMRSYGTRDADPFRGCIYQVARATSAAPTFFEPVEIDDVLYGDGGTGWNNPTKEAIAEARNIWPRRPIGIVISIGTGLEAPIELKEKSEHAPKLITILLNHTAPKYGNMLAVAEYAVNCLTSCEKVHNEIAEHPKHDILMGNYFRLNVPQGIGTIGLAEWDKLNSMIALTNRYMEQAEMKIPKHRMANILLHPEHAG